MRACCSSVRPACVGATPARPRKRSAERLLHVADARGSRRQREVRPRRARRDAAGLDHVAEQAEIGEIEPHATLLVPLWSLSGSLALPSCLANPGYANYRLRASRKGRIFAVREACGPCPRPWGCRGRRRRGAGPALRLARTLSRNGRT